MDNRGKMKLRDITILKKEFRRTNDPDALRLLLLRSVTLGHKRLALLRCLQAEKMGMVVDDATAEYCRKVAETLQPGEFEQLLRQCK